MRIYLQFYCELYFPAELTWALLQHNSLKMYKHTNAIEHLLKMYRCFLGKPISVVCLYIYMDGYSTNLNKLVGAFAINRKPNSLSVHKWKHIMKFTEWVLANSIVPSTKPTVQRQCRIPRMRTIYSIYFLAYSIPNETKHQTEHANKRNGTF